MKRYVWKIALFGVLSLVVLVAAIVWAICRFGAPTVEAFGSVMSFMAVFLAACATVVYVFETQGIAKAARDSAKEQARVASLMEKDLLVRIAPFLRCEPLAGATIRPNLAIRNSGSGTAYNVVGKVTLSPMDVTLPLNHLSPVLEPRRDFVETVWFSNEPNASGYSVVLTCTDSLESKDYTFVWGNDGRLVSSTSKKREERT